MVSDDGFYPDKGRSVERAEARRLLVEAAKERDRKKNAQRITDRINHGAGVAGRLQRSGREELADSGREKESDAYR